MAAGLPATVWVTTEVELTTSAVWYRSVHLICVHNAHDG